MLNYISKGYKVQADVFEWAITGVGVPFEGSKAIRCALGPCLLGTEEFANAELEKVTQAPSGAWSDFQLKKVRQLLDMPAMNALADKLSAATGHAVRASQDVGLVVDYGATCETMVDATEEAVNAAVARMAKNPFNKPDASTNALGKTWWEGAE